MSDWDAAKYHRISDPQLAWGRAVAARLAAAPGEHVLDIGCGTGRLTAEIARAPEIFVVGLDRSAAMLREAARRQGKSAPAGSTPAGPVYVRGDGSALPFVDVFDAVFSAATFHWIPDHDRLFASIHQALKPGGRLVAQAGGQGNLDRLYGRARLLMRSPAWSPFFSSWIEPSHFEDAGDTERRLARAGFRDIEASITPAPVTFGTADGYAEFTAAVCLRHQLDRLPLADREPFMEQITEQALADDPPLTLDYRRLNITARKGRA